MAEQEAENDKIKIYEGKKKVLDDNIFNTQKKIDTLEGQKLAIEQQMHIVEEVLNDQINRRDENQKLLDARKQECTEEVADYAEAREKAYFYSPYSFTFCFRLEQIGVVEKIITLTETGLATMK